MFEKISRNIIDRVNQGSVEFSVVEEQGDDELGHCFKLRLVTTNSDETKLVISVETNPEQLESLISMLQRSKGKMEEIL